MAKRPPVGSRDEDDRLGRVDPPRGYTLGKDRSMKDVLELEADLLASEGLDPSWPGFEKKPKSRRPSDS